jgi:hypothetical protein
VGFIETTEEGWGQKNGRRRREETPWWTDGMKEAVRRKNNARREWFNDRIDDIKREMEKIR